MDAQTLQVIVAAMASATTAVIVIRLARRRLLSFRYTIGWLSLSALGVFAGIAIPLIEPIAQTLGITPAALLALGAGVLVLAISIQLSISISGLQERIRILTEELARLRYQVDRRSENSP